MSEKTDWTILGLVFALVLTFAVMVGGLIYLATQQKPCTTESVK